MDLLGLLSGVFLAPIVYWLGFGIIYAMLTVVITPIMLLIIVLVKIEISDGPTRRREAKKRKDYEAAKQLYTQSLIELYGTENAPKLLRKEIWKGMTIDHILISKGQPDNIQIVQLKEAKRIIYYYRAHYGKWKYTSYIFENGLLISWKSKFNQKHSANVY